MFAHYKKAAKRLITFMVVGLFFAIFASSAFAECGPGFSSKSQLISYAKHNPSWTHGFRKELLAHKSYTGYQPDETVLNYLRSSEQQVHNAPSGYHLNSNTYCPGGPGQYVPYPGLLENMPGKAMLWHCPKGENCVPLLKGYCMNFVMGPPCHNHHPKKHRKHKCGCRPPKKKHHKHKKPPIVCKQGTVMIGNGCSPQTVNQRQECEVHSGSWNENTMVCVQIGQNGVCSAQSGVVNGNNNTVNQEVKCGSTTEVCVNNSCNVTVEEKPCGCKPEEPEKPLEVEVIPEKTQEFEANETAKEAPLCAIVRPVTGTTVLGVYFEAEYGHVENHKAFQKSAEKFCTESYKATSGHPPFRCTEAGLDPSAEWCDILTWTAEVTNGVKTIKVSKTIQAPWIEEHPF